MDPQDDSFDFLFKIILIGDSNVGKTCLVQSFSTGRFCERQQNTIGVDFTVRTLSIEGRRVKMQVWDTAGQERFRNITQSYYRSAHGAMIAYDISRRDTFDSLPRWIDELKQFGAANVLTALIGNKRDLEAEREVQFEEACKLADTKGLLAAVETSARDAWSVEEAFVVMARRLLMENDTSVTDDHTHAVMLRSNSHTVSLTSASADEKKPCAC